MVTVQQFYSPVSWLEAAENTPPERPGFDCTSGLRVILWARFRRLTGAMLLAWP